MVDKPLVILQGGIESPPFSTEARRWTGFLLRKLQQGHRLGMPDSRAMPSIGAGCHELRINDTERRTSWRVIYRIDADAILVADVFAKKTQQTPQEVSQRCRKRLRQYDKDRRRL